MKKLKIICVIIIILLLAGTSIFLINNNKELVNVKDIQTDDKFENVIYDKAEDVWDDSVLGILTIEKIDKSVELPKYAHPGDAGMDVCANMNAVIQPHDWELIKTGIKVAVPEGFEMQVRPRSGLALTHGISVLNTPGTIDSGYRGEVGVVLINHSNTDFTVKKGDRIAQLVIAPVISVRIVEGEVDKVTERGEGGFGSTGVSKEETKNVPEEGTSKEV